MAKRKPLEQLSPAYRKRVERAEARGKTRAEARGHRQEAAEKRQRRERYHEQFGASPEKMAKLRRQAREHMTRELGRGSKGPVNVDTIAKGVGRMTAEVIEDFLLPASGDQIRQFSHYSYEALILDYPEFENDAEHNPFWYH